jgi:hypothetical protein
VGALVCCAMLKLAGSVSVSQAFFQRMSGWSGSCSGKCFLTPGENAAERRAPIAKRSDVEMSTACSERLLVGNRHPYSPHQARSRRVAL